MRSQARSDMIRLLRLFAPYRGWLAAGVALSLVTLLANVGLMAVAGHFIAAMAMAGIAGQAMNYFTPAAQIRLFAILRTGGRYAERLVSHEATLRLLASLRVWFYARLEPLAPARLQFYRSADLANRIQSDIDTLDHVYLRFIAPLCVAGLGGVVIVAVMTAICALVALTTAVFLILAGVALPLYLQRQGREPGERLVASRAALRDAAADGLLGMAELRVYGATERHERKIANLSERHIEAQRELNRLTALGQGGLVLAANLAMWCAVALAIPMLRAGALSGPDLPMLALFALAAFEAVTPLPQAFQALGETLAAARRLFEIIDAEPAVSASTQPSPILDSPALRISGLSFRYGPDRPWVLRGLDLDLPAGARLALVGETGGGKSSVAQLLVRFWDYQEGHIELGGYDLRDYRPEDVREHIGLVSQDAYIFNSSVLENLLLARPRAEEAEVVAACRAARIHDFILSLPQGYLTELGEAGTLLSGGQARRIAIARAFLKNAPILILDEPTEGLDGPTEREILAAIDNLMRDRSVLLISHRLETLSLLVDTVAELEHGRIVSIRPVSPAR